MYLVDHLPQDALALRVTLGTEQPLESAQMCRAKGLGGSYWYVGTNAGALPVAAGDRIDRTAGRDPHPKVLGNPAQSAGVGPSSRGVAHHLAAVLGLHVVGELLRPRERLVAGEHVHRSRGAVVPAADRTGPELVPPILRPPVELVDEPVGWQQVTADRRYDGRIPATVAAAKRPNV